MPKTTEQGGGRSRIWTRMPPIHHHLGLCRGGALPPGRGWVLSTRRRREGHWELPRASSPTRSGVLGPRHQGAG